MTDASQDAEVSEDAMLMQRVAAGDEAAFRRLAARHLGRMLRLAQKTLGSAAEADDVTQEALLRLWTHAASWRPERGRLGTWLYTIVYRLCLDRLRRHRTVALDEAEAVEDPNPGAFESLARAGDLRRLATALHMLQPRQRAAVTLFYYEELSGEEAAAILGLRLRGFWSLLHRARQSLHVQMDTPPPSSKAASP
jgi:RNA polymerase sigma-70 factor (ECF subfamily)